MSNKSFLKGAAILGAAGIIVKIMGAFFRIPLGNIIGSEGMGYYQASYPIYVLLLTVSTAGIPTAISKLVAEKNAVGDRYGAHRIFKVSFRLLLIVGIVTFSIMFFGAKTLVGFIKNDKAYYSMLAVSPALLFVPVMAAFRGYFQGLQDMFPTAISQIFEQFGRVVIGIALAMFLLPKGIEVAAAGASFGAASGAITGTLIVMVIYYKRKGKILIGIQNGIKGKEESASYIIKKILAIAIPITIGAAILPVMNTIDAALVMRRLTAIGYTQDVANSLYGQFTGMAAPLINLPQVLTVALAMSLVPAISHFYKKNDHKGLEETVLAGTRVALLIGLPAAIGLVILAKPIMLLLYPLQMDSAASAAEVLKVLGWGVIFLTLVQTFTAILQGLGKPIIPVINLFIGAIFKIAFTYTLTAIPAINVKGAAAGTVAAYLVASILNFIYVKKYTKTKFSLVNFVIKPVVAVGAMAISVMFIYNTIINFVGNKIATLGGVATGGVIYIFMLLCLGAVTSEDFQMVPGGSKISKILNKIGLLKK
ncbi:putative polysaccharide biosynthesis protein [Anaeromicrobium sediminis]|uniref:Stage V sporulation protein B n=1 Tax=Anaeromicrobium sediminis TaxID=1478221 RepID=A0A267MDT2_9FIRM|nr:polysaccharide biosynthesis protein [Anaeromicrobium sediminis]PAB57637.1 stage V sporulation protein B [Anaeromicrobium sediminis]